MTDAPKEIFVHPEGLCEHGIGFVVPDGAPCPSCKERPTKYIRADEHVNRFLESSMYEVTTPGPWIVETRKEMDLPSKYLIWAWDADRQLVASMVTREADARLIAAAPRLLEALETLAGFHLEAYGAIDPLVVEALAAAKGE